MFRTLPCDIFQKRCLNWVKILRMSSEKWTAILHPLYELGNVAWHHPANTAGKKRGARTLLSQGWLRSKAVLVLDFTTSVITYHSSPKHQCLENIYLLYFAYFSRRSCSGCIYCPKASHFGSPGTGQMQECSAQHHCALPSLKDIFM